MGSWKELISNNVRSCSFALIRRFSPVLSQSGFTLTEADLLYRLKLLELNIFLVTSGWRVSWGHGSTVFLPPHLLDL